MHRTPLCPVTGIVQCSAVATAGQGLKSGWTISAQSMSAVKVEAFVTVFLLFHCFPFQLIYKVVKEDNGESN